MATLVVAAAGAAIGGSIGGTILGIGAASIGAAIGFQVGGVVDSFLFSSGGGQTVEGPRLNDLTIQSSAYGAPVPLTFGTVRVAGNIIWSTGLIETRHEDKQKAGGGKGGRSQTVTTVSYSYSSSIAVGLGAREIVTVSRIWADGKLLRDESGKLAVGGTLRIYQGTEGQMPDPLIEIHEGVGNVPAFRGLAYVVFEDLELAEYANRIPNLTFEVITDAGGNLLLEQVVLDLAHRAGVDNITASGLDQSVQGFVIPRPMTARAAIEPLARAFGFDSTETDTAIILSKYPKAVVAEIDRDELAAHDISSSPGHRVTISRLQEMELPREISIQYTDPERDYQTGVQRARRLTSLSRDVEILSLPLVLAADQAKNIAEMELSRRWLFRDQYEFSLPLSYGGLAPGDIVSMDLNSGPIELTLQSIELGAGVMRIAARRYSPVAFNADAVADVGLIPVQSIAVQGDTRLELINLPSITSDDSQAAVFYVSAAGENPAWRGCAIYVSEDEGVSYQPLSVINSSGAIGVTSAALATGPTASWDHGNSLNVMLLHGDMELESVAELSVLNGANAAIVGDEIIQFREAVLEVEGSYTLRGLLRGRRGTENAVGSHISGERFALLESGKIFPVQAAFGDIGKLLKYKALTAGQTIDEVTPQDFVYAAQNLKPYAPVHVTGLRDGTENLVITWVRRTRVGGSWRDGVDVPLGETTEAYLVEIYDDMDVVRTWSVAGPVANYSAAEQTADFGSPQASVAVKIYQISEIAGRGQPAISTV